MRRLLLVLVSLIALHQTACDYGHLAAGQLKVLWRREPIEKALRDPARTPDERTLLALVDSVRTFARELGLEVGDQYTSFVAWPGDRIVTTLVRTRPGSLDAVGWWYPFLGRLPYRGYFDVARAEREARRLREDQGYDVCVSPVTAYSTLGWLDDPVTSPMLGRGAAPFVETLLHELVHATVFVEGDADFNEGVALFIGQEAAIRYFAREGGSKASESKDLVETAPHATATLPSGERVRAWVRDRRRLEAAMLAFRDHLPTLSARADATAQRAAAERALRGEIAAMDFSVLDPTAAAASARLSDACLALSGTYTRDLPLHASLLAEFSGDLGALVAHLVAWSEREAPVETFFEAPPQTAAAKADAHRQ